MSAITWQLMAAQVHAALATCRPAQPAAKENQP